jgi:hypothetical protein
MSVVVPQDQIDLNAILSKRASISIDPEETPEEHTARLRRENGEATFELVKAYVLFFTIVGVLLLLGAICIYEAVIDPNANIETKRVAWTLLSSLFTGSVSFVLGQKSAKAK